MFFKAIGLLSLASATMAVCHGFDFDIGDVQLLGQGINRRTIYDTSCNPVDGLTTADYPCTRGIFGCTHPPIHFNQYPNTFTEVKFQCRTDPSSGAGGNDIISICCRNDGN